MFQTVKGLLNSEITVKRFWSSNAKPTANRTKIEPYTFPLRKLLLTMIQAIAKKNEKQKINTLRTIKKTGIRKQNV